MINVFEIKLATLILCAVLKFIGETKQHNFQRFVLPIVLVGAMILIEILHLDKGWIWTLFSLIMIWPVDEGYKFYGKNDQIARAGWLAAIGFVAWLEPTIKGHLDFMILHWQISGWFVFVPYVALAGAVGRWVRNWDNRIGAPLNGITIGLPICLIH